MQPGNEVTIEDIGFGLLMQFKVFGYDLIGTDTGYSCKHMKHLSSGYDEVELNDRHFDQHIYWFQAKVTTFSISSHYEIIQDKA